MITSARIKAISQKSRYRTATVRLQFSLPASWLFNFRGRGDEERWPQKKHLPDGKLRSCWTLHLIAVLSFPYSSTFRYLIKWELTFHLTQPALRLLFNRDAAENKLCIDLLFIFPFFSMLCYWLKKHTGKYRGRVPRLYMQRNVSFWVVCRYYCLL